MNKGTVYWITGLSGAGKTTIGTILYQRLKQAKANVVLLDGDALRETFGNDLGFSRGDRMKSAMRNARLCKLLADQQIDVVCCTISMFDQVRDWNQENNDHYKEIYIKVPMDVLKERNQKNLYVVDDRGNAASHVAGLDILIEEPKRPDIEILNDGLKKPDELVKLILEGLNL